MNEPKIDPETLAALLDGRLSDAEREEVIARLAASEAELEAYVDAVAVVHELEAAVAGGEAAGAALDESTAAEASVPTASLAGSSARDPGSRRFGSTARRPGAAPPAGTAGGVRRFVRSPRRLAMAAAIAAVTLAPVLWWQSRAPAPVDPAQLAALLGPEVVPADGYAPLWSATRSAGEAISPTARAARIGVRLVDLEVAVRAGDATAVAALAREIAALLDGVPAGGPAAAVYRQIAARPDAASDRLADQRERGRAAALALVDARILTLAAWAEAAHLAAVAGDAGFLRSRESRRLLGRADAIPSLPAEADAAIAAVTAALTDGEAPPDWRALERELVRLVRALAD